MSESAEFDVERVRNQVRRTLAEFRTGSISQAISILEEVEETLTAAVEDGGQVEAPPESDGEPSHACEECGKAFASRQALAGHQNAHGPSAEDGEEEEDDE